MVLLLFLLICIAAIYVFIKGNANKNYFKDSGLKYLEPTFMFGSSADQFLLRANTMTFVMDLYQKFPGEKAFGFLGLRTPNVLLKDPELVKQLTVKQFDHFTDHQLFLDETMDTLFGNSLFNLRGQKWRDMRATLSPAFTGSKMRLMFQLIEQVTNKFVENLNRELEANSEYEMKDLFSRFTNDIIASCAFGIEVDSLKDKENEFYLIGKQVNGFGSLAIVVKLLGYSAVPALMKFLQIELMSTKVKNFFRKIVLDSMEYRTANNIQRPDMITLLMQANQGKLIHEVQKETHLDSAGFATVAESEVGKSVHKRNWTDNELVAQCFLFFLAGFDSISSVMSMAAYELVVNPEIQERLYEEIKEADESLEGGEISYEGIQKLKYMDQVVSEVLRKWPAAPAVDRACVKDLDFDDGAGFKYHFKKGDILNIPIYGFHRDPKYFAEPEKFDPDRFNEDNLHNINPDTYLPFGIGPRNCIGSRLALMTMKTVFYKVILNFELTAIPRTEIPLTFKKNFAALQTKNGIWVGLKGRRNN